MKNSQKNRLQKPDSYLTCDLWDVSYICLIILGEGNGIIWAPNNLLGYEDTIHNLYSKACEEGPWCNFHLHLILILGPSFTMDLYTLTILNLLQVPEYAVLFSCPCEFWGPAFPLPIKSSIKAEIKGFPL